MLYQNKISEDHLTSIRAYSLSCCVKYEARPEVSITHFVYVCTQK